MVAGPHTPANQRRSDPVRILIELGESDDFISIFNDQNMFGILNFGHCNLFGICIL
jgi:hypothetical protein